MQAKDFRKDINGLRALAVFIVVFYHFGIRGTGGGFIGVDLFFVISGYLMTKIIFGGLSRQTFSYWRFIAARAARIWPAMACMILLLLLAGAVLLPPFDLLAMSDQARSAVFFLSNYFFNQSLGYFAQGVDNRWLLHTWSLSVEWQFYMLYPLLLMAIFRLSKGYALRSPARSPSMRRAMVIASMIVLLLLSLGYAAYLSQHNPGAGFFSLGSRAWEMLAGGLIFFVEPKSPPRLFRTLVSYSGLVLIAVSVIWVGYYKFENVWPGYRAVVPVLGAVMVIWAGASRNILLGNVVAQKIGTWSYSIYLWHWPIAVGLGITGLLVEYPYPARIAGILMSIFIGALSFQWIESRRSTGQVLSAAWVIARKPLFAMVLAACLAWIGLWTAGLEFRAGEKRDFQRGLVASMESESFPKHCGNHDSDGDDMHLCSIDKNTERHLLVIGDSHAEHLYPWFSTHAELTTDFFTMPGCPLIPQFNRIASGYHCIEYSSRAWQMAADAHYDTIIVSANWAGIGPGTGFICHEEKNGSCTKLPALSNKNLMVDELKIALSHLLELKKTVVVLDGTPISKFVVPPRLARENFWTGKTNLSIAYPIVTAENLPFDQMFTELTQVPGFHRVSLRGKLCNPLTCKVYDETLKRPVFHDADHFDPVWIENNGEIFLPFVH